VAYAGRGQDIGNSVHPTDGNPHQRISLIMSLSTINDQLGF